MNWTGLGKVVVAIGLCALAGCGSKDAAKKDAAADKGIAGIKPTEKVTLVCDTIAKDGECAEFVAESDVERAKMLEDGKKLCPTAAVGVACPAAKQVGTCRMFKFAIDHFYADGPQPYTRGAARQKCEKGAGRWIE